MNVTWEFFFFLCNVNAALPHWTIYGVHEKLMRKSVLTIFTLTKGKSRKYTALHMVYLILDDIKIELTDIVRSGSIERIGME